ncbi:SAGA-associated factor 29 [[Candida] anglica]|uniref:SAGA-associated factor 29 n=1 Tax=[Candida] anglica TaxID=148631 RepID=A0ABP0EHM8_9ASCO
MSDNTEGYWDIIVTSLQDICNANEATSFDGKYSKYASNGGLEGLSPTELQSLQQEVMEHKQNVGTARRLVSTSQQNLQTLLKKLEEQESMTTAAATSASPASPRASMVNTNASPDSVTRSKSESTRGSKVSNTGKSVPDNYTHNSTSGVASSPAAARKKQNKKAGRSFYTSVYNPSEPILVGSEVAYKLKNRHFEEWIQCEVMRVIGDGNKFEIRDPEPDENNNPGQTFRANYKEILLIPPMAEVRDLVNYAYGCKVLARYPETTTFYPAVVVGHRKDGTVRLKFDGEEEVNKETEVERRLVLPFPEK